MSLVLLIGGVLVVILSVNIWRFMDYWQITWNGEEFDTHDMDRIK
jgi:hypothetical protein